MLDQAYVERLPSGESHPSVRVDSLRDLCAEAMEATGQTVTTASLSLAVIMVDYLIRKAPEHPVTQSICDTMDQSVLAIVLNRTTESMTSVAKRFKITKQAVSKKCLEFADRLGMPMRAGKSASARKSYDKRARAHHDKRRRELKPFNIAALTKGIKPCRHSKK